MRRLVRPRWGWLACAGIGALVPYFLSLGGSHGRSVTYQLVGFAAAAVVVAGARRRTGAERCGWLLIALGIVLFSVGDGIWDFYYGWALNREAPYPSIADAPYVAAYPAFAAGIVLVFPWRRIRLVDLIDVGVLTASAGGVMWFAWISPAADAGTTGTLARVVSGAYPTMDFLLMLVLVYAAFATATWPVYLRMLVLAFAFMLAADLVYMRMTIDGTYTSGSWVDAGWLVNYVLLGAAALHPSRAGSGTVPRRHAVRWGRFALVACASLTLPAAIFSDALAGTTIADTKTTGAFATAVVVLVIVRMWMLLREQNARESERARLLRRSVEASEQERRRIARDLHDGPIQAMTAITLKLDLLGRRIEREHAEHSELVDEIRGDLAAEIGSLRHVMAELRPPILDDRGLTAALDDCARTVLEGSGIDCAVESRVNGCRLAQETEAALYRVAREALINVRKHAHARRAHVVLEETGDMMRLRVTDDGVGFEADARGARPNAAGHLGLVAMEEGITSLGGLWTIRSAVGKGTTVEAALPLVSS